MLDQGIDLSSQGKGKTEDGERTGHARDETAQLLAFNRKLTAFQDAGFAACNNGLLQARSRRECGRGFFRRLVKHIRKRPVTYR